MTNSAPDAASPSSQSDDTPKSDALRARKAALDILRAVIDKNQTLDQALGHGNGFSSLPARDKGFCRMLATTALRRLGQVDDLIRQAERNPGTTSRLLQNILRVGVTQIMFMDVPDHAAVDTTVRLAEQMGVDRQKSFVNGVLRTMTREGRDWLARQDEVRLNTPEWLLKIWIAEYGLGTAAEIAKANITEAPLDITIKDEGDRAYYSSNFKATEIGAGSLRQTSGGAVHEMDGFHDGKWWVQDAAAALPAALFGDVNGKPVIDLCAAPGGKTMQLAARGADVTALDRSANRLERLKDNLARMDLSDTVDVVVADAAAWTPKSPAPYILLDAPCSATGTIRRHPDVPYLKSQRDIDRLVSTQKRILDNAFEILAVGGVLIYCVCSLQKSEGEAQIEAFLSAMPNAKRIAITPAEIGGIEEAINESGDVRVLPFHQAALGGMDGFYISRLMKVGAR